MSDRAPYSRVYWSVMDDPKFEFVYYDDGAFALWVRLLMVADAVWPSSATLPRSTKKRPLEMLVKSGIVDLLPNHRYRVHGLDSERGKRAASASDNAKARWDRTAPAMQPHPGRILTPDASRAETRRDEKSRADAREDDRPDIEAFLLVTRRAPTERQRKLLDGLLDRHDRTGAAWAADIILRNPNDPIGAVIEADKEWRAQRIAEAQAAEKPKPQPHRPRGLPQSSRDLLDEWARQNKIPKGAA